LGGQASKTQYLCNARDVCEQNAENYSDLGINVK
jgi:hypothetical protein